MIEIDNFSDILKFERKYHSCGQSFAQDSDHWCLVIMSLALEALCPCTLMLCLTKTKLLLSFWEIGCIQSNLVLFLEEK